MLTFLSLTINITGPLNIKIIQDENVRTSNYWVSISGNKYIAIYDGINKTNADNKSIGGKSNKKFYKELQKELNKLKFKG